MIEAQSTNSKSRRRTIRRGSGIALTVVGVLLLIAVAAYYGLGRYNSSRLEGMNASIQGPAVLPDIPEGQAEVHGALMPDRTFKPIHTVVKDIDASVNDNSFTEYRPPDPTSTQSPVPAIYSPQPSALRTPEPVVQAVPTAEADPPAPTVSVGTLISTYNSMYPGFEIHPKYWDRPLLAGADPYEFGVIMRPDGYMHVSSTQGLPRGSVGDAVHIRIPSIGVDSDVANLAILELEDSREYETPSQVVGRIPVTSNPGELGNSWLFGHLESIIKGEGNVFRRLPDIPGLLNSGDPVYVTLLNEEGDEFLYQVTATEVVHEDELALYDTDDATITLVACVPRLVYDHRILVTGKLVGIKLAS